MIDPKKIEYIGVRICWLDGTFQIFMDVTGYKELTSGIISVNKNDTVILHVNKSAIRYIEMIENKLTL